MRIYHGAIRASKDLDLTNPLDKDFDDLCKYLKVFFPVNFIPKECTIEFYDDVLYQKLELFALTRHIPAKFLDYGYIEIYKGSAYCIYFPAQENLSLYAVHKSTYIAYLESLRGEFNLEECINRLPKDSDWIFLCSSYCETLTGTDNRIHPCPQSYPRSFPLYCQTTFYRKLVAYGITAKGMRSVMTTMKETDITTLRKIEILPGKSDYFMK